MRFLVLIPAFIFLLSNMPFIHEMPVEKEMTCMTEEMSCEKNAMANKEMSCHPGKEQPSSDEGGEKNCCNSSATNSVCICVFTFAAPAQEIKTFQFRSIENLINHTGYLPVKWKDPHIASPVKPPDVV